MNTAKKTALPKLPHGEGTMSYDGKGNIVYKKWIVLADGSKYRKTITASSITECFKKMMEEEENASHLEITSHNVSSLEKEMLYWLNSIKKSTLKVQSWERLESTIRNIIIPSSIGKKKIDTITSKNIQAFINSMNTGDYCYSSIKKTYDCLNDFFRYLSLRDGIKNPMLILSKRKGFARQLLKLPGTERYSRWCERRGDNPPSCLIDTPVNFLEILVSFFEKINNILFCSFSWVGTSISIQ